MQDDARGFEASVLDRFNGFLYRCKTDADYTMIHMTSGMTRVLGYPVDEVLGNRVRSYGSMIHPEDVATVDKAVSRGLEKKTNFEMHYRLQASDGRHVWVHETGGGIWSPAGDLLYLEGAVTDIHSLYESSQKQMASLSSIANKTTDVLELLRYLKLLSLNAGIEAARAGEAGASFAVLAQEMRKLASQSEELTKSIATAA